MPSLSEFMTVARSYSQNVERLVDGETLSQLREALGEIEAVAILYRSVFLQAQPRIEQNKLILKALARNFKRSLMMLQNEAASTKRYNERGRSVENTTAKDGVAFVRVRA